MRAHWSRKAHRASPARYGSPLLIRRGRHRATSPARVNCCGQDRDDFGPPEPLREDEALAYAEGLLAGDRQIWGRHDICRFCEAILIRQGKVDEAYHRFGLLTAAGNTWLAMWRDLVKRYPDRDARCLLEDLIALHGCNGKWFAAAKTAKYFDIALDCAADSEAVCPDHWRHVHNRLTAGLAPRAYTPARHAAW